MAPAAPSHLFEINFEEKKRMLHHAVVFLVIALIAALIGFGGIALGAAGIVNLLIVVFVVLAIAGFVFSMIRKA
jgi:uncharacterized membrane protein YtjA (UPF0391 family)